MRDFLPLGLCRAAMIVPGLSMPASIMRRSHVVRVISTSQFQRADVLDDPALSNAINRLVTEDADAAGTLPDRQTLARCELAPLGRTHIA